MFGLNHSFGVYICHELFYEKMKKIILLLAVCCSVSSWGQPFQIGHRTITYNDPNRTGGFGSGGGSGRQIQCEVYYPSTTAGDNTPFAAFDAPVITFGHGFVMSWDAYTNIWENIVPQGYVLIFPRTEGGFSPVHADFAKDLVVASNRFTADCSVSSFFAFDHWNGKQAVMGHSMGGGSTLLAASDSDASFDLLVGLAPAETTPSAITAAGSVVIPAAIFSGTEDAVTPPADHHIPIYNALNSACKQLFSISGGAHCYFANSNAACDFGESSSGGNISISRADQHDILFDGLQPLLKFYLLGDCSSWTNYAAFFTDARITTTNSCNYVAETAPTITLNGTSLSTASSGNLQWYLDGNLLSGETGQLLDATLYGNGIYTVRLNAPSGCVLESNEIVVGGLSVEHWSKINYSVYPVPSSDLVYITMNTYSSETLKLIDLYGKVVLTVVPDSKIITLSISELNAGMYHVISNSGAVGIIVKK